MLWTTCRSSSLTAVLSSPWQTQVRLTTAPAFACRLDLGQRHPSGSMTALLPLKCQAAARYLGGQVLAEQGIGAPQNKVVHDSAELRAASLPLLSFPGSSIWLPAPQDGPLEALAEGCWGPQHPWVAETDHRIELHHLQGEHAWVHCCQCAGMCSWMKCLHAACCRVAGWT